MSYRNLALILTLMLLTSCGHLKKKSVDSSEPPKLLSPKVKKIWIPSKMKDGGLEWEEGHYIYRIERGTTWSR